MLHDTHCHLGHCEGDPAEIVRNALEAGVATVVDVGMGLAESRTVTARASNSDGTIRASVGIHPNDLDDYLADPVGCMAELGQLAANPAVVGIGETGLDFFRTRAEPDDQRRAFADHIELAKNTSKALVIHCRDAHDAVLEVLDEVGSPQRVIMHCFSGDPAFAAACMDRNYWCSFAGNVTYKKNDELREALKAVRPELLLVETDAPYLSPLPHRGKPNSPALVVHTAQMVAETIGMDFEALQLLLDENTSAALDWR